MRHPFYIVPQKNGEPSLKLFNSNLVFIRKAGNYLCYFFNTGAVAGSNGYLPFAVEMAKGNLKNFNPDEYESFYRIDSGEICPSGVTLFANPAL